MAIRRAEARLPATISAAKKYLRVIRETDVDIKQAVRDGNSDRMPRKQQLALMSYFDELRREAHELFLQALKRDGIKLKRGTAYGQGGRTDSTKLAQYIIKHNVRDTSELPSGYVMKEATVLMDRTYKGDRYTYGLDWRPLAYAQVPDGWIIQSNRASSRFNHGTVDYPFRLSKSKTDRFELTFVKHTRGTEAKEATTKAKQLMTKMERQVKGIEKLDPVLGKAARGKLATVNADSTSARLVRMAYDLNLYHNSATNKEKDRDLPMGVIRKAHKYIKTIGQVEEEMEGYKDAWKKKRITQRQRVAATMKADKRRGEVHDELIKELRRAGFPTMGRHDAAVIARLIRQGARTINELPATLTRGMKQESAQETMVPSGLIRVSKAYMNSIDDIEEFFNRDMSGNVARDVMRDLEQARSKAHDEVIRHLKRAGVKYHNRRDAAWIAELIARKGLRDLDRIPEAKETMVPSGLIRASKAYMSAVDDQEKYGWQAGADVSRDLDQHRGRMHDEMMKQLQRAGLRVDRWDAIDIAELIGRKGLRDLDRIPKRLLEMRVLDRVKDWVVAELRERA